MSVLSPEKQKTRISRFLELPFALEFGTAPLPLPPAHIILVWVGRVSACQGHEPGPLAGTSLSLALCALGVPTARLALVQAGRPDVSYLLSQTPAGDCLCWIGGRRPVKVRMTATWGHR